jgi:hypothetical protein
MAEVCRQEDERKRDLALQERLVKQKEASLRYLRTGNRTREGDLITGARFLKY